MKATKILVGFLLILMVAISLPVNAASLTIKFMPQVEIEAERIYLEEIAKIQGNAQLVGQVGKVDLGPAPRPGRKVTLVPAMIYNALQRNGIDLDNVNIVGLNSAGVIVKKVAYQLNKDYVMQEARNYFYDKFPQYQDMRIELARKFPDVLLPDNNYQVEVGSYRGDRVREHITLPVNIMVNGEQYRRIYLNLEFKIFDYVFVVTRPINRKTIITSDMVERRYVNVTGLYKKPVVNEEDILGKEATRTLRTDSIIYWKDIQKPELIQRNDQVTIQVIYGSIIVQTVGIAQENGARGDLIWVENVNSGEEIRAQVVSSGTVQIKLN